MIGCFKDDTYGQQKIKFMIYCLLLILNFSYFTTSTAAEFEIPPTSVQDAVFQRIFGDKDVLLSFLNATFVGNPKLNVQNLTGIDIRPREPKGRVDQPKIRVTDSHSQHYIVEMQRVLNPFQVNKFQYYSALAYCEVIEERHDEIVKKGKKDPYGRELYSNLPNVIVIVITETLSETRLVSSLGDMNKSSKNSHPNQETNSTYSIFASIDEFGEKSKFNFLFIDLEKFNHMPTSSYEKWIHFMKHMKDGNFNNELEPIYKGEAGIGKALEILREENKLRNARYDGKLDAQYEIAKRMFERKKPDEEVAEMLGISLVEVESLKNEILLENQ